MTPSEFYDLFKSELPLYTSTHKINNYYKFTREGAAYGWRKAYFIQRLEYIYNNIVKKSTSGQIQVWDVGCGFGSSSLFLAMNGIRSIGTTLESYHYIIPERKQYWQKYGNVGLFEYKVEDLFETNYKESSFDYILVQDTLHHIEPIDRGVSILHKNLKSDGKLVVVDENGSNIFLRAMLYRQRGNDRIIETFDENLGRKVTFGNENIRSLDSWQKILANNGFDLSDIQFIRFLPPFLMNEKNFEKRSKTEQEIWKKSKLLRESFYWGLNFVGSKVE